MKAIEDLEKLKTIRNDITIQGMKNSYIRDSSAIIKYFAWLQNEIIINNNKINE